MLSPAALALNSELADMPERTVAVGVRVRGQDLNQRSSMFGLKKRPHE